MDAKELGMQRAHPVRTATKSAAGNDIVAWKGGLTKREAFAMAAMQGLCANPYPAFPATGFAYEACKRADALLIELAKESP